MADYKSNRSGNTYSKGTFGARFYSRDVVHSGAKGGEDGWNDSSFLSSDGKQSQPWLNQESPEKRDSSSDYRVGGDNNRRAPAGGPYGEQQPPEVREFIRTIQNGASNERRTGFPSGMFQRRLEDRNGERRYETGDDRSTNGWKKNGGGYAPDAAEEHLMITCGRAQPGRTGRAAPHGHRTPISSATNDIGVAVSYLKDSAARPSPGTTTEKNKWSSGADATPGRSPSLVGTIDSSEAAKKYNGYFM